MSILLIKKSRTFIALFTSIAVSILSMYGENFPAIDLKLSSETIDSVELTESVKLENFDSAKPIESFKTDTTKFGLPVQGDPILLQDLVEPLPIPIVNQGPFDLMGIESTSQNHFVSPDLGIGTSQTNLSGELESEGFITETSYQDDFEPHQFAPVTHWLEFTGDQYDYVLEHLEGLEPAHGISAEAGTEWISGFVETLPTGDEWILSLGLADMETIDQSSFTPFLTAPYGDGMALTFTCVLTEGGASCDNAVTTSSETPAVPQKDFKGICTTLSTAYSLVYTLGKFSPEGTMDTKDGKKFWKKGVLERIKTVQGHTPAKGTVSNRIKNAYEPYGCECDDEISIDAAGGVDKWLDDLKSKANNERDPHDCHLFVDGVKDGMNWGHDLHVDGVDEDGNIVVANTGQQGSGSGEDVPVVAQPQEWKVQDGATGPEISCEESTSEASKNYWNNKNPTKASYICCSCLDDE